MPAAPFRDGFVALALTPGMLLRDLVQTADSDVGDREDAVRRPVGVDQDLPVTRSRNQDASSWSRPSELVSPSSEEHAVSARPTAAINDSRTVRRERVRDMGGHLTGLESSKAQTHLGMPAQNNVRPHLTAMSKLGHPVSRFGRAPQATVLSAQPGIHSSDSGSTSGSSSCASVTRPGAGMASDNPRN